MILYMPQIFKCAFTIAALACLIVFSSHDCTAKQTDLNVALETAATHNDLIQIKALVQQGANPNSKNEDGVTALMRAAQFSHLESVQELLKAGANPAKEDIIKKTALMYACEAGSYPIAELLLEHKAEVNLCTDDLPHNMTPLIYATQSGNAQLVKLLVDHQASVNFADNEGETALMSVKNAVSAKLLIDHRANVNARTEWDGGSNTPLLLAIARGHVEVVSLLVAHGADVNVLTDELTSTPYNALIEAVEMGNVEVVKILLSHGARVNVKIPFQRGGDTALQTARRKHNLTLIMLLKKAGEIK